MRKGFTLIELLAVIVILAVIALIATPIILDIISNAKKEAFKNTAYGIIEAAKDEYIKEMYSGQNPVNITFNYTDSEESSDVAGKSLNYSGAKPNNGKVTLTKNGDVSIAIHDGTYCAYKSYSDSEVMVDNSVLSDCITEYSSSKGVNVPELADGMTPIKWNGTTWITTTISDKNWYDYTTQKWANAKTADGSMWVWIPRYIYKIETGWHSTTTGTIQVQFSKGIKDNWNSSITLNTGTGADASNNTWTNQPAFKFGNTELGGIWVAKFEPTAAEGIASSASTCNASDNVTTKTIKVLPNVTSWRCIIIGNAFTVVRNMEASGVYGWDVSSGLQADGTFSNDINNIDTHLMKNTEWGAVAYLSKSTYGQGVNEIWINPADDFTTGCAGNSAASVATTGCLNAYNTTNGQKASTTGNIYGVYDLSGGVWESVAAYLNNGNSNLNLGTSILNAGSQYKNVYPVGGTDNQATNYGLTNGFKGDAIYETGSNTNGTYSWFNDWASMLNTSNPWFGRGGRYTNDSDAGVFAFNGIWGGTDCCSGFRPILLVSDDL